MEAFLPVVLLLILPYIAFSVSDAEAALIARRQLEHFSYPKGAFLSPSLEFDIKIAVKIRNPQLRKAYTAFQALKNAIHSDPNNFTGNWAGPYICTYNGIFCSPSPSDPSLNVVTAVDLNGADIAGFLPAELGFLEDAAIFHANSNRFCGVIPESFAQLKRMFELDLSNNRLAGTFPNVLLKMPSLKYLDLRYNDFEGQLPQDLFNKDLDALFLNSNRFDSNLPENFGNSTVSIAVLANNHITGCIPRSIARMGNLNELILMNNDIHGCLPVEAGFLSNITVFDIGFNSFSGFVPESFARLMNVEELDVSHNMLTGVVPKGVCELPKLTNFTLSFNYFKEEPSKCLMLQSSDRVFDDSNNCISGRQNQRGAEKCALLINQPVDCHKFKCGYASSPQVRLPYEGILPPAGGYSYASPPPPMYPLY